MGREGGQAGTALGPLEIPKCASSDGSSAIINHESGVKEMNAAVDWTAQGDFVISFPCDSSSACRAADAANDSASQGGGVTSQLAALDIIFGERAIVATTGTSGIVEHV